jgi:spoIIIJ-associated protein
MLKSKVLTKIEKEAESFFRKICPEAEIEIGEVKDLTVPLVVKINQPQILIGQNGRTLFLCQQLLAKILKKKIKEEFYIDLDINGYKKKKIDYLKELARLTADEVSLSKKEKVLEPMSSYERRIIHLELKERRDVVTESMGQEPERRIVIKPIVSP